MQFVKITIGKSVSIHDVKFYACTKAAPIPAVVFGDDKGETRLTSSRHWDKHYAYFKTDAAPSDKVGYVAITFEEYTDLATKKAVLKIEKAERPAGYTKRLTGYATRIDGADVTAEAQEAQAEVDAGAAPADATTAEVPPERVEQPAEEQETQPTRPERRKNKAH
jgi:hypothetical protein